MLAGKRYTAPALICAGAFFLLAPDFYHLTFSLNSAPLLFNDSTVSVRGVGSFARQIISDDYF